MKILWQIIYPIGLYELATAALFLLWPDGDALLCQGISALVTTAVLLPLYEKDCGGASAGESRARRSWRLAFGGIGASRLVWLLLAGASASICFNSLIGFSGLKEVLTGYEQTAGLIYASSFWRQALLAGVVIPAAEELIFRGFLYGVLRRFSFPAAAAGTAALFGLYHGSVVQGVYAFMTGLVLALCRETCGCWGAALLVHISANLTSLAVQAAAGDLLAGAGTQAVLAAAGALVLWGSLRRLSRGEERPVR